MLNYMKEGAIFNYTRLTILSVKFRRLATLYLAVRQVGHERGNMRNRGFQLAIMNNAASVRQVEEKCCRITLPDLFGLGISPTPTPAMNDRDSLSTKNGRDSNMAKVT